MKKDSETKNKRKKRNFIKSQIAITVGYIITQLGTYLTKELGFSSITNNEIILFSPSVVGFTILVTLIIVSQKTLSNSMIIISVQLQFLFWLFMYGIWVFMLHEARNISLLFTFMPLIFLILNSNFIQSIIISIIVVIIQLGISYYAIVITGQSGSFLETILYVVWFLPSALFVSYTAGIFYTQRIKLVKAKKVAEQANESLWGEMEIAKKIQTILLPKNPNIPGYKIAHYMNPTDQVGGDYYDIIQSNETDWIIIGDVSGHGVPAGLIMMMAQSSIRTKVMENPTIKPSELLKTINRSIKYNINNMDEDKFMTITAFSINKNDKMLFSGKHEDIIYYNSSTDNIDIIKTDGILVSRWDFKKSDVNLEQQIKTGDIFILYTDGITESWQKGSPETERVDHMFGVDRLKKILLDNCRKAPEEIKNIILSELNNYNIDDDITFIIVKKD